jgi:uncharacterized membrane protein YhaH (DUF805 family)
MNIYFENYMNVLKRYVDFNGRASRSEFWMFVLVNLLVSIAITIVDKFVGLKIGIFSALNLLYTIGVLLPSIAVAVRRLHDTSKSGWWYFIALIPIIGTIALIIFWATDSTPGENQYGANPNSPAPASVV